MNLDLNKRTNDLTEKNREKQQEVDSLLEKVQSKKAKDSDVFDQRVRGALQKARKNVNLLQKISNGIYKVKNKPQVIMLNLNEKTKACLASYTDAQGEVVSCPITEYVYKI